jgi:cardiolipin synthase
MSTVWWALASSGATALLFVLYTMMSRGRGTPFLKIDVASLPAIGDALPMLAGLTQSSVHEGNDVRVLQNGEIFPAMLEDIAAAEHCVHLETFVWSAGSLETQFVDALVAKARAGLSVCVLLDALGASKASEGELQRLEAGGVRLAHYCEPIASS